MLIWIFLEEEEYREKKKEGKKIKEKGYCSGSRSFWKSRKDETTLVSILRSKASFPKEQKERERETLSHVVASSALRSRIRKLVSSQLSPQLPLLFAGNSYFFGSLVIPSDLALWVPASSSISNHRTFSFPVSLQLK